MQLQTVGTDGIEGAQAAVETRQDAQVILQVVQSGLREHIRRHVLVLDASEGHDRGRLGLVEVERVQLLQG